MKKFLFSGVLILLSTSISFAQLFVGGSFNISTSGGTEKISNVSVDKQSTIDFNLNPKVGFFINSNMAVGANISLGLMRTNNNSNPEVISTTTSFGLSPFIRYYFMELGQLSLFGEGNIIIEGKKTKIKSNAVTVDGPKSKNFGLNVLPAASYKLSDKIEIEAFLGGLSITTQNDEQNNNNSDKTNRLSLEFSTSLQIGFIYKF